MMTNVMYADFGETLAKSRSFFLSPARREEKNTGMISTKKRQRQ